MKKAGLYDKNRYPYNARLLQQSANTSFDTRGGSSLALGSGVRSGGSNVQRASRHNRSRGTPAGSSADTRSYTSDRMADFDGFSETRSQRSFASSRPRMTSTMVPQSGAISTILMDDNNSGDNLMPTVRIRTKFTWAAFVLQLMCSLLWATALFSPGWGRAKQDRTDDEERRKVFLYYGLYLRCTLQQYEEYWGDLDCITNAIAGMAGKRCSYSTATSTIQT